MRRLSTQSPIDTNITKKFNYCISLCVLNSSIHLGLHPSGALRSIIALCLLGSVYFLLTTFFKRPKSYTSPLINLLISSLLTWGIYTIARSITSNTKDLISLFGHYLMAWTWMTPLAFFYGQKIYHWANIYSLINKITFLSSLLTLLSPFMGKAFGFGLLESLTLNTFQILLFPFFSTKRKAFFLISLSAYFISSFTISQRANFLFIMLFVFFSLIEWLRRKRGHKSLRVPWAICLVTVGIFIMHIAISRYNYISKSNNDLTTDTRTFLFIELFDDLTTQESYLGRGALGRYYSPYFKANEGDFHYRSESEVGYLHIILKGGIIMIFLKLALLLPASIMGIFFSNNTICRQCGYSCLAYIIMWSLTYCPIYGAEYLLLWMSAGTCLSKQARLLSNQEISQLFNPNWLK